MKKDGRTHDRKTKETIRMMAAECIIEGEDVAVVMDSYGLCAPWDTNGLPMCADGVAENIVWLRVRARDAHPSSPALKSRKCFAGLMARIRCSMALTLPCGRELSCES